MTPPRIFTIWRDSQLIGCKVNQAAAESWAGRLASEFGLTYTVVPFLAAGEGQTFGQEVGRNGKATGQQWRQDWERLRERE